MCGGRGIGACGFIEGMLGSVWVCGCVGVWSVEWRMWVGVCGGRGWGWGVKECVWRGGGCAVHVGMCGACGVCVCMLHLPVPYCEESH